MERIAEQTPSDLAANYARNRFSEEILNSTPVPNDGDTRCENCRKVVDRVTLVPEYEYMGCDDCMEEALLAIAKESRILAEIMGEAHVTQEEAEALMALAFMAWADRKPAKVARMQGELFPEVA